MQLLYDGYGHSPEKPSVYLFHKQIMIPIFLFHHLQYQ